MLIVKSTSVVEVKTESDVVHSRQLVRKISIELKFSIVDQTKIVTAVSEIARNTVIYGKGGHMTINIIEDGFYKGIQLVFEDKGPGIPDIDLALRDGYTSGSGMGLGLSGSKRLVNQFTIESVVGKGTKITLVKWDRTR